MRRLSIALALVSIVAVIAACAAPAAPGWTYAPAPSVTPAASAGASGSPAASAEASASAAPEASATAEASAGASGGAGVELKVTAPVGASVSGFDPTTLEAPADTPFKVTFDNQDNGVPHNWVLQNPDGSPVDIGDDTPFNGVEERTFDVPALSAGDYPFICQVHPTTMTGTLTVK
ncbi:MAG TPA: cupredoxin domain-containing protein [Candidatus Limnocylindrales bacterium]|nr:cupredoxin domain-containing protein [Candidatus Limnocylindrales bacterium]